MFIISVETRYFAGHQLSLRGGRHEDFHSHNWSITARASSEKLNKMGLVMNFHRLKVMVDDILSELFGGVASGVGDVDFFKRNNSSAENVSKYIYEQLESRVPEGVSLLSVMVTEEPGCSATFYKSEDFDSEGSKV